MTAILSCRAMLNQRPLRRGRLIEFLYPTGLRNRQGAGRSERRCRQGQGRGRRRRGQGQGRGGVRARQAQGFRRSGAVAVELSGAREGEASHPGGLNVCAAGRPHDQVGRIEVVNPRRA